MIETTVDLPNHYEPSGKVDLVGNKKAKWMIYLVSLIVVLLLFFVANRQVPILALFFDLEGQLLSAQMLLLKLGVIVLFSIFFSIIHEKLHGHFMARYADAEVKFTFKGSSAYVTSEAFYSKRDFRIILLAPVAIMVVAIFIVTLMLSPDWFWVGYIIQIINLAGSMSDFYIAWQLRKEPSDVLISDLGPIKQFYVPGTQDAQGGSNKKRAITAKQKKMQKIYGKKRKK